MKKTTNIITMMAFMAGITLTSCQTKEQKVEKAQEEVQDANLDLKKAQQEYRNEAEMRMNENEKNINDMKANMNNSKEKVDVDYSDRVTRLEQQNRDLNVRLRDYNNDDKNNWEEFKREFNHDMDELGAALKDLGKDNKK